MSRDLLTTRDLADRLQIPAETVKRWRKYGSGPRYFTAGGRAVRYRLRDVEAWEESRIVPAPEMARTASPVVGAPAMRSRTKSQMRGDSQ